MTGFIRKIGERVFSLNTLMRIADRIGTVGCALPLIHFVLLPFSVFFYVIGAFLSHAIVIGDRLTIEVPSSAIGDFYWLLFFWTTAVLAAFVFFAVYRVVTRSFASGTFARAFSKTGLAFLATSGTVERMIANVAMPSMLKGTSLGLSVKNAPDFRFSLYTDLGALVSSPYWQIGSYSYLSRYSYVPLTVFTVLLAVYFAMAVVREVKTATGWGGVS